MIETCPLCGSQRHTHFCEGENRLYRHCKVCDLVFVPKQYFVSTSEEKSKYDHHQNSPDNVGYCRFLDKLLLPLEIHLKSGDTGLDFGSGPGPTLSILMQRRGYVMDIYDIFYHDTPEVFDKEFDFITSTEVIEHLHNPLEEIKRLWSCVREGGVLGLMSAFRVDDFASWYYKRDLTHIIFFTESTFVWLAKQLDARLIVPESGVVILKKGEDG